MIYCLVVESSGWMLVLSSGAVCDVVASCVEAAEEIESASSRIKSPRDKKSNLYEIQPKTCRIHYRHTCPQDTRNSWNPHHSYKLSCRRSLRLPSSALGMKRKRIGLLRRSRPRYHRRMSRWSYRCLALLSLTCRTSRIQRSRSCQGHRCR